MAPRLELNTAGKWQIAIVDHHRKRRQPAAKRATAATNYRTQLLGERIYRSFVLRVKLFLYLFMPSRTTALAGMPKITLVQITDFVILIRLVLYPFCRSSIWRKCHPFLCSRPAIRWLVECNFWTFPKNEVTKLDNSLQCDDAEKAFFRCSLFCSIRHSSYKKFF